MRYRVGRFRHKIVIERRNNARDVYGAPNDTWTTLFTTWAQSRLVEGYEKDVQNKKADFGKYEFVMRTPNVTVTVGDRILMGGKYYDINSVGNNNVGAENFTIIMAYN